MVGVVDSSTLAALFRQAGAAHHRAFAAVNGADPEWPAWYAEYLVPRLEPLLRVSLSTGRLANDLAALDAAQRAHAPGTDWAAYYAAWFLARYPRARSSAAGCP